MECYDITNTAQEFSPYECNDTNYLKYQIRWKAMCQALTQMEMYAITKHIIGNYMKLYLSSFETCSKLARFHKKKKSCIPE